MTILDTVVFKWFLGILSPLWNDNTGKIFLLTFAAYSSSYLIYSGYLSWFAKGFGGLPLSQTGFNIVDFLTLLPATFILLIEFAKSAIKYLLTFIFIPLILVVVITWAILFFKLNINVAGDVSVANLGILFWLIGVSVNTAYYLTNNKIWYYISIILSYAGTVIFSLTISANGYNNTAVQNSWTQSQGVLLTLRAFNEILALPLFVILCFSPYLLGFSIGELSVKQKFLNEIIKLTLKEPISIAGCIETQQESNTKKQNKKTSKPIQKKVETTSHNYEWSEEKPIYLIAAFSQTTAIYVPPETSTKDRGEMLLLRNDLINLMVLKGGKDNQGEVAATKSEER